MVTILRARCKVDLVGGNKERIANFVDKLRPEESNHTSGC